MQLPFHRVAVGLGIMVAVVACSGDDDEPKTGNGVNDVRAACDIRAQWNRAAQDCSLCEAAVVSPRCECVELRDFSAACENQAAARKTACAASVDECVFKCQREDCACIDACYVDAASCKAASAARDGCIAEACSPYCR